MIKKKIDRGARSISTVGITKRLRLRERVIAEAEGIRLVLIALAGLQEKILQPVTFFRGALSFPL